MVGVSGAASIPAAERAVEPSGQRVGHAPVHPVGEEPSHERAERAGQAAAQAVHHLHHVLVGAELDGHAGEEVGERAAAHRRDAR